MKFLNQSLLNSTDFSVQDWELFLSLFRTETLRKGDYFGRENNKSAKIGFVTSGILKSYHADSDDQTLCYLSTTQQWIGHFESFMYQKNSPETIQAISDCQLETFGYAGFQNLQTKQPAWAEKWASLAQYVKAERSNSERFVHSDPKERYEYFIRHHQDLALKMPLEDTAAYLQIPYPTLVNILYETVVFS